MAAITHDKSRDAILEHIDFQSALLGVIEKYEHLGYGLKTPSAPTYAPPPPPDTCTLGLGRTNSARLGSRASYNCDELDEFPNMNRRR